MMFVSHRMEEIYRIADRIAVLRDGRLIGMGADRGDRPRDEAVQMMVGRPLERDLPATAILDQDELVLDVEGLSRDGAFADVSFTVRAGEIVGLGGLVGSGRTEIARVLFGIDRPTRRRRSARRTSRQSRSARRGHGARESPIVSEDRIGQSLVMDFAILANASLPTIDQATIAGLVRRRSASSRWSSRISSGCGCASAATTSRSRRSPAATSRRSCWPSGWPPTRGC